eukprot:scaffold1129_cov164-Amphora_coffeaeformis.AAC.10
MAHRPKMDPDQLSKDTRQEYGEDNMVWTVIYFCLGLSRSEKHRTLYNAARPFTVLGGVSDEEVLFLQNARGPYAKTALCFVWLQEFISRETLLGSSGDINGAILSRLFQYQSDGMVGYNSARKIAYVRKLRNVFTTKCGCPAMKKASHASELIAQLSLLIWFAGFMNSLTVLCFLGLHEVGKEICAKDHSQDGGPPGQALRAVHWAALVVVLTAQYNEALGTMFSGYHPDSWFTVEAEATTPSYNIFSPGRPYSRHSLSRGRNSHRVEDFIASGGNREHSKAGRGVVIREYVSLKSRPSSPSDTLFRYLLVLEGGVVRFDRGGSAAIFECVDFKAFLIRRSHGRFDTAIRQAGRKSETNEHRRTGLRVAQQIMMLKK